MTPVPVIFILSGNYAGSHLLARLLGAHRACADIGELRNLPKFSRRPGSNASGTAAAFGESPLFEGFLERPPESWHAARARAHPAAGAWASGSSPTASDASTGSTWFVASPEVEARCVHLLRDPGPSAVAGSGAFDRSWPGVASACGRRRQAGATACAIPRAPEAETFAWLMPAVELREIFTPGCFDISPGRPGCPIWSCWRIRSGPCGA
ncbi:MAG: hypothetical protein U5R48_00675 [Gammaproteobacteria bacterium]|nr:hypothetical protein [Gammaproteobacteria bacterium]